jgi:hypothetical protein
MAGVTGLEPATSAVTGQRSNQLSYTPLIFLKGKECSLLVFAQGVKVDCLLGVKYFGIHYSSRMLQGIYLLHNNRIAADMRWVANK